MLMAPMQFTLQLLDGLNIFMSLLRVNRNNFGNSYICGSGPPKEGRAEKIKSQKADRCDEKQSKLLSAQALPALYGLS